MTASDPSQADIAPGVYRTRESPSLNCYWARLSGLGGTFEELIANGNSSGPVVVEVLATDVGFESNGCGEWTTDLSQVTDSTTEIPGDGVFIVGTDLEPGQYQTAGTELCYWARLSGFGAAGIDSIIANGNPVGPAVVEISAGDRAFETTGCGAWTKIG